MTPQKINEAVAFKLGWIGIYAGWMAPARMRHIVKEDLPDYCHSIEAAWEIVEFMSDKRLVDIACSKVGNEKTWSIHIDGGEAKAKASTAPMAICLAFLKLPSGK